MIEDEERKEAISRIVKNLEGRKVLARDKLKYHAERALFHIERCYHLDHRLDTYRAAIAAVQELQGEKVAEGDG